MEANDVLSDGDTRKILISYFLSVKDANTSYQQALYSHNTLITHQNLPSQVYQRALNPIDRVFLRFVPHFFLLNNK